MSQQNNNRIGEELIQLGWRQGSMFSAKSTRKSWLALDVPEGTSQDQISNPPPDEWRLQQELLNADDFLVVTSQTCDIQRSPEIEPYVECVRAYWTSDRSVIHEAGRNSVRRFLLQNRTTADGKAEGLIADATSRLQVAKAALLRRTPEAAFEESEQIASRRFRAWLAKRYDRPAVPDDLVVSVQKPLNKAIGKLRPMNEIMRILDGIRSILFSLKSSEKPLPVEMWLIRDERSGVPAVSDADAMKLTEWISNTLESGGGNADLAHWELVSLKEIRAYDYLTAYELPTDQYSLAQDDEGKWVS